MAIQLLFTLMALQTNSHFKLPFQKCGVWQSRVESAACISRLNRNTCSPHVAIGCSPHCCVRTGEKFTAGLVVPGREVYYVFKIEKEGTKRGSETFIAVFTLLGGETSLCNTLPISHSTPVLYFQWGFFFFFSFSLLLVWHKQLLAGLAGWSSCQPLGRQKRTVQEMKRSSDCLSDYYCWCLS